MHGMIKFLTEQEFSSLLQIHWIRMWSYLQPVEFREAMVIGCNRLETVTPDLFSQFGWRRDNRITAC
jgi:hypothetical protein